MVPILAFFLAGGAGCGDDGGCPTGEVRVGTVCVPDSERPDGGPDGGGGDGGDERCSGVDDDGDGRVDEGFDVQTFYPDADDDGFGTDETCSACGPEACGEGTWVMRTGDCDDGDRASFPGGAEMCDGADNDCDGEMDEGAERRFYADRDRDGFGDEEVTCDACVADDCPAGETWVELIDCDDECDDCFEGAEEICDELDNDCDLGTDEGVTVSLFVDEDCDGFGVGAARAGCLSPEGFTPPGFATRDGDCADDDLRANPDATRFFSTRIEGEVSTGLPFDFNCDGAETTRHMPCLSCQDGFCYQPRADVAIGDPVCGRNYVHQPTTDGPCRNDGSAAARAVTCR
ncbi:MAG: putative metal-binding motif-containing protein [Myxococcota bacterium]